MPDERIAVNPIHTAAGLIQLPARAAAAVVGTTVGVATAGVRTTARAAGRLVERIAGAGPDPVGSPWTSDRAATADVAPEAGPAPAATQAPAAPAAKKATAKKATAKKATARKTSRRAPSKKAAVMAPALGLTEDEAEDLVRTPSGIPAVGDGSNPDTTETDLHQPGTEPVMDPATVKAAASEAEMMGRAADPDKG